jgi:uncharacterized repeat protein (TIGR02543 family)
MPTARPAGTAPAAQTKTEGIDLTLATNSGSLAKTGYSFAGWNTAADASGIHYAEGASYTTDADLTLYAEWTVAPGAQQTFTADGVTFKMNIAPGGHTFPTGTNDSGTATVTDAYWIGETEVTYELWYAVYTWATGGSGAPGAGQYTFANPGTMGDGSGDTNQHPVTTVNWRDAMAWSNALTEWCNAQNGTGYTPVYYTDSGYTTPIRSVDDSSSVGSTPGDQDNPYVKSDASGFRLLTSDEWELAARWRDDGTNTVTGYSGPWFTQGDSASGATADYTDVTATGEVAWYYGNSGDSTHEVKGKTTNSLGLYDMSGNVWEWCFDWFTSGSDRVKRGGSWNNANIYLQVGVGTIDPPYMELDGLGFRFARGVE